MKPIARRCDTGVGMNRRWRGNMSEPRIFSKVRPMWFLAAAVAIVGGLLALGVPFAALLTSGALLICPLIMVGMHGTGHGHGTRDVDTPRITSHEGTHRAARASSLGEQRPG